MSKETAVIALGLWVMALPFLGVPRAWLTVLMIVTALGFVALGFLLRAEALSRAPRHAGRHQHFVEHMPHSGHDHQLEGHDRKERINSLN